MRTPTTLFIAGGALLLLTLTACGSTSSSGESANEVAAASPVASAAADVQPDLTEFRDCMSENGVTLPDMGQPPAGGAMPSGAPSGMPTGAPALGAGGAIPLPEGVDQTTFEAAQAACADLRPAGGPGEGAGVTPNASAMAAFASCLTDHGVTVPEGDTWMTEIDRSDPTVKAATDTCAPLLPEPEPAPSQ